MAHPIRNLKPLSSPPFAHQHQLHAGLSNALVRTWQNGSNCEHRASDFVLPVFIVNEPEADKPVKSLPGISQLGIDTLINYVRPLYQIGLRSLLLFPVMNSKGLHNALDTNQNPLLKAIALLKQHYPDLVLLADVCLCAFSEDGHCCVFDDKGRIDDDRSIEMIANIALAYAHSGIDVVAPSDMNDGRILAIKQLLREHHLQHVSVMSYSAKFASCLYGPFRDAAGSAPKQGTDRSSYQLPMGSTGLAVRAAERDAQQGADFLMVKPGTFYLDIIRQIVDRIPHIPMAVYQVSGEYSMLVHGAQHNLFDLKQMVFESICAFKRAGAQIIITYFTPQILQWMQDKQLPW